MFGGYGIDSLGSSGDLNDLWQYSLSAKSWTWISGFNVLSTGSVYGTQGTPSASNVPGARQEAVSWIDGAGNLWLFGGVGVASSSAVGDLNDLWEYSPSANTWTWISGSNGINARSVYGTKNVSSPNTVPTIGPGARQDAISWFDSAGNLWLFGGFGTDSMGNVGNHNDLWKFPLK